MTRSPGEAKRHAVSRAKTASSRKAARRGSKATAKKKAAKKAGAKKAGAKKTGTKKAGAKKKKAAKKKSTTKKKAATKRRTAPKKKTVAKKKAAAKRKAAAKKSSAKTAKKKSAAKRKTAAKKKSAAKRKTAAKKASAKKSAAKKASAKKSAAKKSAAKKSAAKKASAKKSAAKKASAKKSAAKKASAKKSAARSIRAGKKTSDAGKVVLAPRSPASVAPSIPIPVKKVARRPSLEQRAKRVEERIQRQSPEFRARYQESFEMSWIYHDSHLEGVVYTYEELTTAFRSDEVTVVDSSVMPIYDAIRRHKAAIEFIREQADKRRGPINVDLLKRIYVILRPEEGDHKAIKYRRDIPQHRLYFHEYAPPDKIAYRVRQIIDWVNNPDTKRNVAPLRLAGKAHYDLARCFPFTHDSGKVARLFMNFLLLRGGMPAAIIHASERMRYYEALKSPNATLLVNMLRDSVANAVSSIEKLLDEHETNTRGFVS